jgi:hypothetical protein
MLINFSRIVVVLREQVKAEKTNMSKISIAATIGHCMFATLMS